MGVRRGLEVLGVEMGTPTPKRAGEPKLRRVDKVERTQWQQRLAAFPSLGAAAVVGESRWYEATLADETVAVQVWSAPLDLL